MRSVIFRQPRPIACTYRVLQKGVCTSETQRSELRIWSRPKYDGRTARSLFCNAQAAGATPHGPVPQGLFLQSLGLLTRASMLARAAPATAGLQLSAAQRLMAAEGMGRLFKALALCHPGLPTPPGFEASAP